MINFILLIAQLWFFTGLTLMLHRITPRFGLTLMLFYIAGLVSMMNFVELFGLYIEPYPGIVMRVGAHVFIPMILLAVLTLYIANGTHTAQLAVFGLTGVNLLVLVVLFFILLQLHFSLDDATLSGILAQNDVINLHFLRGVIAATITFFANMLVIVIFYQGMRNAFSWLPTGVAVAIALVAASWTDAILFNLLQNIGTPDFNWLLPGDVIAKTLSALIVAPIAAYYLTRVVPHMPGYDARRRPTFDIIFSNLGGLEATLRNLQGELRESKQIYQQLTDNIDQVFWLATVGSGRIEYISPAFERLTGYPPERFYEHPNRMLEIFHDEDRQRIGDDLISHIYAVSEDEFRLVRADEQIRWIRNRVFPIHNETGEMYRIAGIFEDITARKQVAQQEFALALEREKVQVLKDFVRDASHDLKSPLTAIMMRVHLIERDTSEAQRLSHLQELREHAERLSAMIDDLFTLSRLESRGTDCNDMVNFNQVAWHVYETLKPLTERKGLNFVVELSQDAPALMGNISDLERMILNLVDNAIRYTTQGDIRLRIEDIPQAVLIEVSDTGIGIATEDLPHIFDRFYRSRAVRSNGISGTGLGLAIVKTVVDAHQGSLDVSSAPGQGTSFRIHIPKATEVL